MGGKGSGRKTSHVWVAAPDREPWERQPSESDPAWMGFVTYRDLGPGRTIAQAATIIRKTRNLKANYNKQLEVWSRLNGWVERAGEWDNEQDRVRREETLKAQRKAGRLMVERHLQVSMTMQRLASIELARWVNKVQANGDNPDMSRAPELTTQQLQQLLDYAVKLERLNRGEPEKIERMQVDGHDDLTEAEIERRIERLLKARE